ncbi:MAG TPA: hypothetical protein VF948_02950 [Methylomirabilota bacterium]
MTRAQITIAAALLACFAWIGSSPTHAASSTQAGNAGTITLNWEATQDKIGRPLIVGHVVTVGGKTGYCIPRLLVETLDAQGQVVARNVGFIPGYVGGYDNVYFEEPIRAPGQGYRVSISSWSNCGGGQ